jgi:DNA-binding NtrC family response regulator
MVPIILCVDDDLTVLQSLRTLLTKTVGLPCRVEIAESGREALEILDELRGEGLDVHVVISDFIMPSMRGDELLVRLHEKSPHMIKIMLTGQADFEGVKRVINEANLYRFLEKPFNNADLALTARSAVQARAREAALLARVDELERKVKVMQTALGQASGQAPQG